ncbi:protocadherin gamma-B5-like isoform X36 [Spea bombifrons]|uniref:protocadherin gamma-B5-like isoform X36 n=1 Tax=Spea bombifrons TaxID=233779 RepID=UPI0023499898|nr:protocadherin gamma-B5-like isoform X36 [Spea bombifrons]
MPDIVTLGITQRIMTRQVIFFSFFLLYEITSGLIQYSIFEESKKGFIMGNVAKDLGLNAKNLANRKLHIGSHNRRQYFNISLDGNLYVIDRIDREAICGMKNICLLNLEVLAENPVNVFHIEIEVSDINDNYPVFSKNIYNVALSESAPPGTQFVLENAEDPDLGTNSLQGYNISLNKHFTLREKNSMQGSKYPELVLEKYLDREKQHFYDLILTAFDGGIPMKTGTALIRILVQDANDNFPVFSQDTYLISLNENTPIGFVFLHLNATDKDEGSYAKITYSFSRISENAKNTFSLDTESGEIQICGPLDFEVTQNYEITVEAKDGGGLATHSTLLIRIIDTNDNAPEIVVKSLFTPIPEDALPGTLVALLNVHDQDSGNNGNVACQITENLPFNLITSSNNYYTIVTAKPLDRETISDYNITITAKDEGSPPMSTKKTIMLRLSDVNDNPPVFSTQSYIAYVPENNIPGTSIHSVHASDIDDGVNAQILYSLLNTNIDGIPISSYLSINFETGVIYAQRSFDYEQIREFQFEVIAKDRGSPSLSCNVSVKVCIIDNNDNAPMILYPSADIEETSLFEFIPLSSEKGYLVTKVVAVDADSGHNAWLSYHLIDAPDSSIFVIGQHTGEIKIARDLQGTDLQRQKIVIMVKDNGATSLSATVTLNIVVAENFQQVVPEIVQKPRESTTSSNIAFYLVVAIALISSLFILTVIFMVIAKCRKPHIPTALGTGYYPQLSLGYPSQFSDGSLPLPYSYDVCVTLDSRQNGITYLKPTQNVPTDNLIDTDDLVGNNSASVSLTQAQPNTEWRFSQAQRPGPSGAQPTEEAGVWPNNQFETERLQAMILASANEAAEGTSGLGGGTGTMGLSARYGPQFTLQHVPDYRQNVYIPGSTLTPTNAAGKRDGKSGGNKKKSGKKEKK